MYCWDDKKDVCYQMYVEEKKTLDEIMDFFKKELDFVPSKRAFQTQFKRWEFPSKQNPAHRNEALVMRTRELWQRNTPQKDMVPILRSEGFDVSERELMRLRSKHKLLLRAKNAARPESLAQPLALSPEPPSRGVNEEVLPPEVRQKRKEILDRLQQDSDERLVSRKRRRRTKGWAHMGPDPPGPPRFPSETTLGQSQTYLNLDKKLYMEIRDRFVEICQEDGIVKKTQCGPDNWQLAKSRLVQEYPHLQQQLQEPDPQRLNLLNLSLDVICTDVTKKLRSMDRTMSLGEAKNILNINPDEGRQLRQDFLNLLEANHFKTKVESGNFEELKARWMNETGLAARIPPPTDPNHPTAQKALSVYCRDIMKRWRDAHTDKGQTKAKRMTPPTAVDTQLVPAPNRARQNQVAVQRTMPATLVPQGQVNGLPVDQRIDPSLLQAAGDPSHAMRNVPANPYGSGASSSGQRHDHQHLFHDTELPSISPALERQVPKSIPAYFRLSQFSAVEGVPKLWLGVLSAPTGAALRAAALAFPGGHGHVVARIEGLVTAPDGAEMLFQIDQDDELIGYLAHVAKGKATFVVFLEPYHG